METLEPNDTVQNEQIEASKSEIENSDSHSQSTTPVNITMGETDLSLSSEIKKEEVVETSDSHYPSSAPEVESEDHTDLPITSEIKKGELHQLLTSEPEELDEEDEINIDPSNISEEVLIVHDRTHIKKTIQN